MQKKYYTYEEIKFLSDNYRLKVNINYLYFVLSVATTRKDWETTKLINNILSRKENKVEWIIISIKELKSVIQNYRHTTLKAISAKSFNSEDLKYDIKNNLKTLIYNNATNPDKIINLLDNPNTTFNQIIYALKKYGTPQIKEAILILYKLNIEDYYDNQINALEYKKQQEIGKISKRLARQK